MSYEPVTPRSPATGPTAEEIASKSFSTARRGLDADEVHRYLMEVAAVLPMRDAVRSCFALASTRSKRPSRR